METMKRKSIHRQKEETKKEKRPVPERMIEKND